jgi:hypothetical protein
LDEFDSEFGFEDTGRVKMMCPARMGGTGESMNSTVLKAEPYS